MILLLLCLILAADQVTKYVVTTRLAEGESIVILSNYFSLTRIGNTGAAWGLFQGQNNALIVLSLVTIAVMFIFRRSFATSHPLHKASIGLILGGIFGNLIDRLFHGHVIDFLDFYVTLAAGQRHWPAFNVADSAICVGAFLYIVTTLWHPKTRNGISPLAELDRSAAVVVTEQK
jgi:signal peptidase II